jgi:glc operon protein GlcG
MTMKTALSIALLAAGALVVSADPTAAQLATKKALTLAAAEKMMAAAKAEAMKNNWKVVIAIVDEGGHLVELSRIDDTQYGSIDIAIGKAQTSAALKRPSKAMEDAVSGGRTAILGVRGVTPLQGGLPIVADGAVIGAIGVSGVTSQQDEQVAKAGVDALPK